MSFKSIKIMEDTSSLWDLVGEKYESSGYFGQTTGLHTVGFSMNGFIGRFAIQATLATDPTEDDWTSIILDGQELAYVQIDATELETWREGYQLTELVGLSGTNAYTFSGNYTYVRAIMNRSSYIEDPTLPPNVPMDRDYGNIRQVLLNF